MNKKGAALMQVLLIAVILAGITTMLLRASLSNTVSSRKSRRNVSAQTIIESCMAEVNMLWSLKKDDAFKRDLSSTPYMYCTQPSGTGGATCQSNKQQKKHVCSVPVSMDGSYDYVFEVTATIKSNSSGPAQITYEITKGSQYL